MILGEIDLDAERYRIGARAVDPVTSEILASAEASARSKADVLQAAERVSERLRRALGDTAPSSALDAETFSTSSLESMHRYALAQEHLAQARYAEAKHEFEAAIEADPEFGRAYSGLAVLSFNQGERDQAERYFEHALARMERMSERERLRTRGTYFVNTGNWSMAIDEFTSLVERYPSDAAGHNNLAVAQFYKRDMALAAEHGRRALEIFPNNVVTRNNLALYAMYAGRFEEATREAERVLELNPSHVKARVVLALSSMVRGEWDRAIETYRRLGEVDDIGASFAALGLGDLALARGHYDDAREVLERDLAVHGEQGVLPARVLIALANVERVRGERDRAEELLGRARRASDRPSILFELASAYVQNGQRAEALELATVLGAQLPATSQMFSALVRGIVHLDLGRGRDALREFQSAQSRMDSWLGRYYLGLAYLQMGAFVEAHSELEHCLRRRGEATAVFLDDVPSFRYLPPVYYYSGRAEEGLGSSGANDAFSNYLSIHQGRVS